MPNSLGKQLNPRMRHLSYTSLFVREFLARNNNIMPPYSPDTVPFDYFCSQKWSEHWRGSIWRLQKQTTNKLNASKPFKRDHLLEEDEFFILLELLSSSTYLFSLITSGAFFIPHHSYWKWKCICFHRLNYGGHIYDKRTGINHTW